MNPLGDMIQADWSSLTGMLGLKSSSNHPIGVGFGVYDPGRRIFLRQRVKIGQVSLPVTWKDLCSGV